MLDEKIVNYFNNIVTTTTKNISKYITIVIFHFQP